jgi:hypothetical protein
MRMPAPDLAREDRQRYLTLLQNQEVVAEQLEKSGSPLRKWLDDVRVEHTSTGIRRINGNHWAYIGQRLGYAPTYLLFEEIQPLIMEEMISAGGYRMTLEDMPTLSGFMMFEGEDLDWWFHEAVYMVSDPQKRGFKIRGFSWHITWNQTTDEMYEFFPYMDKSKQDRQFCPILTVVLWGSPYAESLDFIRHDILCPVLTCDKTITAHNMVAPPGEVRTTVLELSDDEKAQIRACDDSVLYDISNRRMSQAMAEQATAMDMDIEGQLVFGDVVADESLLVENRPMLTSSTPSEVMSDDDMVQLKRHMATQTFRVLEAIWRFSNQSIFREHTNPLDRAARRRAERAGRPPEWGDVRLIDLRRIKRPAAPRPEGTDEDAWQRWSHRWVVNGFWRNQWYPKEQIHRRIYIHPYVKGPEHLPLIVKDDVRRVVR